LFKHVGNELARSRGREKIAAVLSDPEKSAAFFAKNPYAKTFYQDHSETDPKVFNSKSEWKKESRPLVLEIGSHHGALIRKWAKKYAGTDFLGMDVTYKRVVATAFGKKGDEPLENLKGILCNAQDIAEFVEDGELSGVCLFFPDPWPKKRQRKHRYVNAKFLEQIYLTLEPGGFFWFKSDDLSYYAEAFLAAKAAGFHFGQSPSTDTISRLASGSESSFCPFDMTQNGTSEHETLFEAKFKSQKKTTYQFLSVKPGT
jgi:tRNA (guanine-N(7)-)-methyltransferase